MKRNDNKLSLTSPRMRGIKEQYFRARRFLRLSRSCKKPESKFRNLIAAVYPARAIAELMLTSAQKQELRDFRNKDEGESYRCFDKVLEQKLPYYSLLKKIRFHDFHRFACIPPDPAHHQLFLGGPIELVAKKGTAAVVIIAKGPEYIQTGGSSIKLQRPLCTKDGLFFDEQSEQYLSLEKILQEYLEAIPKAIDEFASLYSRND